MWAEGPRECGAGDCERDGGASVTACRPPGEGKCVCVCVCVCLGGGGGGGGGAKEGGRGRQGWGRKQAGGEGRQMGHWTEEGALGGGGRERGGREGQVNGDGSEMPRVPHLLTRGRTQPAVSFVSRRLDQRWGEGLSRGLRSRPSSGIFTGVGTVVGVAQELTGDL